MAISDLDDASVSAREEAALDHALGWIRRMTSGAPNALSTIGHSLLDGLSADETREALRLCGTARLPVSRSFLARAIAVARMERSLGPAARFVSLRSSHKVELAKLRDPAAVERLAGVVSERHLSVQALRALVMREGGPSGSTRGPKPVSALLRELRKVRRITSQLRAAVLAPDQSAEAFRLIESIANDLHDLSAQLTL